MASSIAHSATHSGAHARLPLAGVEVVREGRVEPFLTTRPQRSSSDARWSGVALEGYRVPACVIARHEHKEHFLHVLVRGHARYEVKTRGKTLRYEGHPGTTFVLPQGTIDELRWEAPTERIAVAIHPGLLTRVLDGNDGCDVELTEHWNLVDPHIAAVLKAMTADLDAGSPAGPLYGESLANALAIYLLNRYAVRRRVPATVRGGLPGARLKRVLDFIEEGLGGELDLATLARIAGMSPHYFAERFRQSTGSAPHRYVLMRRIERAKRSLADPRRSVIDAGLDAGFGNASHFARVFRRFVGTSPSRYRAEG